MQKMAVIARLATFLDNAEMRPIHYLDDEIRGTLTIVREKAQKGAKLTGVLS